MVTSTIRHHQHSHRQALYGLHITAVIAIISSIIIITGHNRHIALRRNILTVLTFLLVMVDHSVF